MTKNVIPFIHCDFLTVVFFMFLWMKNLRQCGSLLEKLLRKSRQMSALKAKLDAATMSALLLFLVSWFSLSRFRFGIFFWCWHQLQRHQTLQPEKSLLIHKLNWINRYWCRMYSRCRLDIDFKMALHLAIHELRYHQLCSLISQRITKRTQRGSRYIKSPGHRSMVEVSKSFELISL
jgi:hypothetical protein